MSQQLAVDGCWVDFRSAVALFGVSPTALAWAMADGDVTFSLRVPGHERRPMLSVDTLYRWAGLELRSGLLPSVDLTGPPGA